VNASRNAAKKEPKAQAAGTPLLEGKAAILAPLRGVLKPPTLQHRIQIVRMQRTRHRIFAA
jgi:hypothetical protein